MTRQKLAGAKRVPASTALLNEEEAIISPPQREALKHQQVAEDKMAVAVRLAEVQKQWQQAEQKLACEKSELVDLQQSRARLICDKKPVNEISDQIMLLETSVEQGPAVIACLRERLTDLQKEQQHIERDTNLSLQKDAAHQMERLSVVLVEQLKQALDTNEILQACERNYVRLREQTGVDMASAHVTHGSDGSLQALYETCKLELEGRRGIRPPVTVGIPPV